VSQKKAERKDRRSLFSRQASVKYSSAQMTIQHPTAYGAYAKRQWRIDAVDRGWLGAPDFAGSSADAAANTDR
jgi:hypothetical protein